MAMANVCSSARNGSQPDRERVVTRRKRSVRDDLAVTREERTVTLDVRTEERELIDPEVARPVEVRTEFVAMVAVENEPSRLVDVLPVVPVGPPWVRRHDHRLAPVTRRCR